MLEFGSKNLNQWLDYERDIRADYEKAFGEAPGALLSMGIMTDTDNTRSNVQAWYGQLRLLSANRRSHVNETGARYARASEN